jgi:hypothetical protein
MQQLANLDDAGRIEPVHRLVEHQQFRIRQQRGRDTQPLLHSERIGRGLVVLPPGQTHDLEHFVNALGGQAAQCCQTPQVVPTRQRTHKRGGFDQRAHAVGEAFRILNRLAQNRPRTSARLDQTEQDADRRRLPRAVRAHKTDHAADRNLERQVVHRHEIPEAPSQPVCR